MRKFGIEGSDLFLRHSQVELIDGSNFSVLLHKIVGFDCQAIAHGFLSIDMS